MFYFTSKIRINALKECDMLEFLNIESAFSSFDKINKNEGVFRNELILTSDAKVINIDNTLVNLFMLLKHNGIRPKQRASKGQSLEIDIDKIIDYFKILESKGDFKGISENKQAVEIWIRQNLINLVNRGNLEKEKISSLKPIHLESYRIRNAKNTRDYFSADQVYLMLGQKPAIKEELKKYLLQGWDPQTNEFLYGNSLDVDSLGILHLIKNIKPGLIESNTTLNQIVPLLSKQAELFCEDIHRLLVYKELIPRSVLIEYIKTITSFHLSIYSFKVINYLPRMIDQNQIDIENDWKVVVDVTDNLESNVSAFAIRDAENNYNAIYNYIKASFQVNTIINAFGLDKSNSTSLKQAINKLNDKSDMVESTLTAYWNVLRNNQSDDDKELLDGMVKYEDSSFDKYVETLMKVKGPYQLKYYPQFLDSISQKNNDRGFLTQGRSKKYPRRFVLGTRLLEALVQIQVLHLEDDKFFTQNISIEDFMANLKIRYGLVINGLSEEEYRNADVNTNLAFKENVDAFKSKLRQIGFYNDMNDAYILQKVRPRYELKK